MLLVLGATVYQCDGTISAMATKNSSVFDLICHWIQSKSSMDFNGTKFKSSEKFMMAALPIHLLGNKCRLSFLLSLANKDEKLKEHFKGVEKNGGINQHLYKFTTR